MLRGNIRGIIVQVVLSFVVLTTWAIVKIVCRSDEMQKNFRHTRARACARSHTHNLEFKRKDKEKEPSRRSL